MTAHPAPEMDFKSTLVERCTQKAKELGRGLFKVEIIDLATALHGEALKVTKKERKKSGIHPDAEKVYELYPKKTGREAALIEISKALNKHSLEYLLDKTAQFAACVAAWPSSYRYFQDGGDRCWNPVNFYKDGHYEDDPSTWKRTGSRTPPPPPKSQIEEPTGWRESFPDFLHSEKRWEEIDEVSQRYIVKQIEQQRSAG